VKIVVRLSRRKAAFVYPIPPAPTTAVLAPWFSSHGAVRVFRRGWDAEAEAYRPAAIAATWPLLEQLLARQIESLTHALIVLARPEDSLLTLEQRRQLWLAFRVPVFEQIIGAHGALLAAECEAHAGLHIESAGLKFTEWSIESLQNTASYGRGSESALFVHSQLQNRDHRERYFRVFSEPQCGCGRDAPRIGVERLAREHRTAAASAH
jgi:hypothetical protein